MSRRRARVLVVGLLGTGLLARSLRAEAGSVRFYRETLGLAGVWTGGGLACGPVRLGSGPTRGEEDPPRSVVQPVALGIAAFAVFYLCALVVRRLPVLGPAIGRVLGFADHGSGPLVALTTLANGAAEEVFFRGAVYDAVGPDRPVARSTAVYALVTAASGNPALVLAATVMGTLFGWQRKRTGGVQAPVLTHLTWSALMLRYLPPLFRAATPGRLTPEREPAAARCPAGTPSSRTDR